MRLRNVRGAKEKIESSKYIVLNYKELKGNYKSLFGNDNPIHIEIGMWNFGKKRDPEEPLYYVCDYFLLSRSSMSMILPSLSTIAVCAGK